MSLANIQTPAGLTFNERKVAVVLLSGTTTIIAKNVVLIDHASLVAATPSVKVSLSASTGVAASGLYGVVTKDVTAKDGGIVQLGGIATVLAGAAVALGNPVRCGAGGDCALATTATDVAIGAAMSVAAGDGSEMKIMLVDGPACAGTDVT
jgi:hypothetical protein